MARKTIGINTGIKKMIDDASNEGESVEKFLSRLLDEADKVETKEIDTSNTNIGMSEETFNKLNDAKLFSSESYNSIIFRLIENSK